MKERILVKGWECEEFLGVPGMFHDGLEGDLDSYQYSDWNSFDRIEGYEPNHKHGLNSFYDIDSILDRSW